MSDILEHRVDHLEGDATDLKKMHEENVEVLTDHSHRLQHLEDWETGGDGRGGRGAEIRLQDVEKGQAQIKETIMGAQSDENVKRIAAATVQAVLATFPALQPGENVKSIAKETVKEVISQARWKDRTLTQKLKTAGVILTALVALAVAILGYLK